MQRNKKQTIKVQKKSVENNNNHNKVFINREGNMRAREVVIKIMIIVIIVTLKMDRMTDWKRKKLWLEQEAGQVYTRLKNTSTTRKTT